MTDSLKTSAIRHPANSPFVIRRAWVVEVLTIVEKDMEEQRNLERIQRGEEEKRPKLNGNVDTGAEVLSVLEYHHNNKLANRITYELIQKAMAKYDNKLLDMGDWMPYSHSYWMEILTGRGVVNIKNGLMLLEKIGFISSNVPPAIRKFYSENYSWYRLNADAVNEYIDTKYGSLARVDYKQGIVKPEIKAEVKSKTVSNTPKVKPVEKKVNPPEPIVVQKQPKDVANQYIDTVCEFHRHIHNKRSDYLYDGERKKMVRDRFADKRTIGQMAQAIIGLKLNPYFQGENEQKQVWNNIEYAFETNRKFEKHFYFAEEKGVTEEIAKREMNIFLSGGVSQYANKIEKEKPKEVKKVAVEISDAMKIRYRDFANNVSAFFGSNMSVAAILAQCREDYLSKLKEGIDNPEYLAQCLKRACERFNTNGLSDKEINLIQTFSNTFCKLQKLNRR